MARGAIARRNSLRRLFSVITQRRSKASRMPHSSDRLVAKRLLGKPRSFGAKPEISCRMQVGASASVAPTAIWHAPLARPCCETHRISTSCRPYRAFGMGVRPDFPGLRRPSPWALESEPFQGPKPIEPYKQSSVPHGLKAPRGAAHCCATHQGDAQSERQPVNSRWMHHSCCEHSGDAKNFVFTDVLCRVTRHLDGTRSSLQTIASNRHREDRFYSSCKRRVGSHEGRATSDFTLVRLSGTFFAGSRQ